MVASRVKRCACKSATHDLRHTHLRDLLYGLYKARGGGFLTCFDDRDEAIVISSYLHIMFAGSRFRWPAALSCGAVFVSITRRRQTEFALERAIESRFRLVSNVFGDFRNAA
jgi:hypothetical protein